MSSSKPYNLRWGILATGGIAQTFTKDLLIDPSKRDVSDVSHTVVAAASSSSAKRAQDFLNDTGCPPTARAYGSYTELVADADVDIIYVATPHSHHFQNTMLCLKAGKNVLCEKAFTTNAAQARLLVDEAKARGLFLMEAVWTRYFPLSIELRKFVQDGGIGQVRRVVADLSFADDVDAKYGTGHRMLNPKLAGGVLLDLGIYSLTWVFQFLYHIAPASSRGAPAVASSMTKYPATGADEMTSMILTFPPHGTHGLATTNLRVSYDPDQQATSGPAIRVQGELGEVQVFGPAYRPTRYRVVPSTHEAAAKLYPGKAAPEFRDVETHIPGHGMFWEADECARCLRDGKKESQGLTWEESLVIMETMDEVRRQNGLKYPQEIESTEYPLPGF